MKSAFRKNRLIYALIFAAASVEITASAHTVRSREVNAVVTEIQPENRTLQVRIEKDGRELEMAWRKQTTFRIADRVATAHDLKAGAKAVVYYRTPLFGKRFITKIVLEDDR